MGTQGAGRKRTQNRERVSAEEDALNLIAREAEARLAAKRAARAEAREIRMKELERQQKEIEERPEKDFIEKGNRSVSSLSATTLASLGGTSSRRGSGDTSVSVDTEASLREIKDSLAEVEEKYKKAMVSNAQLDNEKATLMYQVDILKDALIEAEEQLAEARREYEEKCKENERQKHAYSILQFHLNEVKETLKQSDELITKHGIAVGPEAVTNGEASVSMNETAVSGEMAPTSSQDTSHAQQETNTEQLGRAEEMEMKSENVEIMQNTEHEEHISETQKEEVLQDKSEREEVHAIERAETNKTKNDIEQSTEEIKRGHVELIQNNAAHTSDNVFTESGNQIIEQVDDDDSIGLMLDSTETHSRQKMMHLQEEEEQQEVKMTESEDGTVHNEASDVVTNVDVTANGCMLMLVSDTSADSMEQLEPNKILNDDFTAVKTEQTRSSHTGEEHLRDIGDFDASSDVDKMLDVFDSEPISSFDIVKYVDVSETADESVNALQGEELRVEHEEGESDLLETSGTDWCNEAKQVVVSSSKLSLNMEDHSKSHSNNNVDTTEHLEMGREASQNSGECIYDHTEANEEKNAEAAKGVKHPMLSPEDNVRQALSPEDNAVVCNGLGEEALVDESKKQEHFRGCEPLAEDTPTHMEITSVHNVITEAHTEAETVTKLGSINYEEELKATVENSSYFPSSVDERDLTAASAYKQDKGPFMENKLTPALMEQMQAEHKYDITPSNELKCVGMTKTEQSDEESSHMLVKHPEISTGQNITGTISDDEGEKQNGVVDQTNGVSQEGSVNENVEDERKKLMELAKVNGNSVTSEKDNTEISHLILKDDSETESQTFFLNEEFDIVDHIQQAGKRKMTDESAMVKGSISEPKLQDGYEIKSDRDVSLKCSEKAESLLAEDEKQNPDNQGEDQAADSIQPDIISTSNVTETLGTAEETHQVNEVKGNLLQTSDEEHLEKCNDPDVLSRDNTSVFSDTDIEIDGTECSIGECQIARKNKELVCSVDHILLCNTDNKDQQELVGHKGSINQDAEEVGAQQEKLDDPAEVQNVKTDAAVKMLQKIEEMHEAVFKIAGIPDEPQSENEELLDTHLEMREKVLDIHCETVMQLSDTCLKEAEAQAGTCPENGTQPEEVQPCKDEYKCEHIEKLEEQLNKHLENGKEVSDVPLEKDQVCNVVVAKDLGKLEEQVDKHLEHGKDMSDMPLENDQVCAVVVEKAVGSVEIEPSRVDESVEGDSSDSGQLRSYQEGEKVVEEVKELTERQLETTGQYVKGRAEESSAESETAEKPVESEVEGQVVEKDSEEKGNPIEASAGPVDTKEIVLNGQEEQATEKVEPSRVDKQVAVANDSIFKDSATTESEKQQNCEDDASAKGSKKGKGKNKEDCIIS